MYPFAPYAWQLFSNGFSLQDTLLLIQGVLYYGLHSWDKIRELVDKPYSDEQLCCHFMALFNQNDGLLVRGWGGTEGAAGYSPRSLEVFTRLFDEKIKV